MIQRQTARYKKLANMLFVNNAIFSWKKLYKEDLVTFFNNHHE